MRFKDFKDINMKDVDKDTLEYWINQFQLNIRKIKKELLSREIRISTNQFGSDLFDDFGLPNVDHKEQN